MNIIKRFLEWIHLKEKLHNHTHKPPLFKEGEMWWCSIGENIGHEINGKHQQFSRPIIVFKKLSANTFLGIPTSTQSKSGSWYVEIASRQGQQTAILSQIRIFDYKRLYNKMGRLSSSDYKKLKTAFRKLYLE